MFASRRPLNLIYVGLVFGSRHSDANPRRGSVINGPRWERRFSLLTGSCIDQLPQTKVALGCRGDP
jgi:hypothetical protein